MKRMKWRIKALNEYIKFQREVLSTSVTARFYRKKQVFPLCFIVGCGRSGTTMLGRLLSFSPEVSYLNEPRPLWIAVSHLTDVWGYTGFGMKSKSLLIPSGKTGEATRLKALLSSQFDSRRHRLLVEKTPENIFRLPWLHSLVAPQAKLIHIVRNGPDVIRSILVEADFNIPYGWQDMNNWYGKKGRKRFLLAETAKQLGLPANTIDACTTASDWAALEWICSLQSYRQNHHCFGKSDCYQLRYEDLLADPLKKYREIIQFLSLPSIPATEKAVCTYVRKNHRPPPQISLSPEIRKLVETTQKEFGYNTQYPDY